VDDPPFLGQRDFVRRRGRRLDLRNAAAGTVRVLRDMIEDHPDHAQRAAGRIILAFLFGHRSSLGGFGGDGSGGWGNGGGLNAPGNGNASTVDNPPIGLDPGPALPMDTGPENSAAVQVLRNFELGAALSNQGEQAVEILRLRSPYSPFETFGLPKPTIPWVPGEKPVFTFDPKNCPNCQPADPEIGLGTVVQINGIALPNRLNEAISAKQTGSTDSSQLNRIKQCGSAVQMLRAPISSSFGNMIDDFRIGCLKFNEGPYETLNARDQLEISQCLAAHTLYEDSCLQDPATIRNSSLMPRIGMLFNVTGDAGAEPACTATLVTDTLIVTARHCYVREALKLPAAYGPVTGNGVLVYAVNPSLSPSAPVKVPILGEVTKNGLKDIDLLDDYPDPADDVIVLRLAVPLPIDNSKLEIRWSVAALGSQLTLIGFQELTFRETLLRDRVMNAALEAGNLLSKRSFADYFRVDHGPMCIVGDVTAGQFGHYCQSFGGTSGAPIFFGDLSDEGNNVVTIVGFQSRGDPSDVPDKEVSGPTNTATQISKEVADLLGLK